MEYTTPLHDAIWDHDIELCRSLIQENKEYLQDVDNRCRIPLHVAIFERQTDIAKLLVESGSDLDWQDVDYATPLHFAVSWHHVLIEYLLKKGANPLLKNFLGKTPLAVAHESFVCKGREDIYDLLTKYMDKWNKKPDDPLAKSDDSLTKPDDSVTNTNGRGRVVIIGGDVNTKDVDGNTPLHIALLHNKFDIAKYLVEVHSADPLITNNAGDNALDVLIKQYLDMAEFLITRGAKFKSINIEKILEGSRSELEEKKEE